MDAEARTFYRELAAVALPAALQSLLSALVSASDAFMLGFLDQASLASISLATQIAFVLSLFHAAFAIGSSVLSAQYWGVGDVAAVERILRLSLGCSLPVSSLFFLAARFFPAWLMRLFTAEPALIEGSCAYLRIVSWSFLCMGVTQMYLNTMKNSGRVAKAALYGSTAVVLNIVLNLVLIFGLADAPRLGIRGAALATVIARLAELLLCLDENRRPNRARLRFPAREGADPALRRQYRRVTVPVLGNEIVWGGGVAMFSVILGHLGSDAVAANAVTNILKNILLCVCTGVGSAAAILVGNRLGAGRLDEARRAGGRLLGVSVLFGALAGVTLLGAAALVRRSGYALTGTAARYLHQMSYISAVYVIAKAFNSCLIGGILCAGGDTRFGFWCDLVNLWGVILPVSAFAAFVLRWPVMAVYFLLNMDEIGKIPFEIAHYRKYKWLNNLTNPVP